MEFQVGVGSALVEPLQRRHVKSGQLVEDSLNYHQVVVAFYRPSGNNNRAGQFASNVNPPQNSHCHTQAERE